MSSYRAKIRQEIADCFVEGHPNQARFQLLQKDLKTPPTERMKRLYERLDIQPIIDAQYQSDDQHLPPADTFDQQVDHHHSLEWIEWLYLIIRVKPQVMSAIMYFTNLFAETEPLPYPTELLKIWIEQVNVNLTATNRILLELKQRLTIRELTLLLLPSLTKVGGASSVIQEFICIHGDLNTLIAAFCAVEPSKENTFISEQFYNRLYAAFDVRNKNDTPVNPKWAWIFTDEECHALGISPVVLTSEEKLAMWEEAMKN